MYPIYIDHADTIIIRKASQVCITEFAIVDMMALARLGVSGMYVLPTDVWKNTFVANRVDRSIQNTVLYRQNTTSRKKDADSRSLKTFFGVNWKFVGSQQRNNFYEFPAGALIIDEFDLCDHANIIYALDRLAAAERPRIRKFGNPTISGVGIDYEYEKSDQKEWFIKCSHCGERQPLDWFVNFVEETTNGWRLLSSSQSTASATALCRGCRKSLDRLGFGEWVAKHPDREISGYHVSRLFGDIRDGIVGQLFQEWVEAQSNPTALQRFYNNVLGITYDAQGSKITEQDLSACACDYVMAPILGGLNVAGCDVGGKLHLHIASVKGDVQRRQFIGTVPTFDELHRICELHHVHTGVIDALPDTHKVKEFLLAHPGWYMCTYHPTDNIGDYKVNEREQRVQVDRTQSLDASYADIQRGKVEIPKDWRSLDGGDFVKQMTALTRVYDEKRRCFVWTTGNVTDSHKRPDHHRHAHNYLHIAAKISSCGIGVMAV